MISGPRSLWSRRGYRIACAGAGLLMALGGCATWRPYEAAPPLRPGHSLPHYVRATRPDSSRLALTAPFVRADSLYGRERGDTVGLPLAEIVRLERQRISVRRTAGLMVGAPVVLLGLTYLIVCADGCQGDYLLPQ